MALNKREKSFCVLEYVRTSSIVTVQRRFRAQFNKEPPVYNSIRVWFETSRDEGCLCINHRPGHLGPSQETVDRVREAYERSPQKAIKRGSLELGISQTNVGRILRKRLRFTPYKLQLHQALSVDDKSVPTSVLKCRKDLKLVISQTGWSFPTKLHFMCPERYISTMFGSGDWKSPRHNWACTKFAKGECLLCSF